MARRLRQTLMDYMVIGISPTLIMGMVGSLLFFLLTTFYHGQYGGRLNFIFAMFTLAIVLIARISMENGIEYASMFAIPLAILTALAMARFVEISGPLAGFSTLINCGLIAIVWWSAHKLTWDCTFIDDEQDASGEGLLQAVGIDSETVEQQASNVPMSGTQIQNASETKTQATGRPGSTDWYQRMVERRRRPHTPGLWVLYYALAALPLFGVGQWLIPAQDAASRAHAFRLICVYVACALGLLLTTSFLGLRRYLRQRNLEMPLDMAGVWLGLGGVIIVAVLLVCLLLPRPGASLTVSQLPFGFGSPQANRISPHAYGNDGPEKPNEATRTGPQAKQPPADSAPATNQQSKASANAESTKQPASQSSNQSQSGDSPSEQAAKTPEGTPPQSDAQSSPSSKRNAQQPNKAESNQPTDQSSGGEQPRDAQQPGDRDAEQAQNTAEGGNKMPEQPPRKHPQSPPNQPQPTANRPPQSAPSRETPPPSSAPPPERPPWNPTKLLSSISSGVGNLLKLLFFAALVSAAAFFAWKYREQVRQALAQLWHDLQNLWASLWGARRDMESEPPPASEQATAPAGPSFASFRDPFASGKAERCTMEELVRYSFQALEAWGREHDCARKEEQTPLEYAQQLARRHAAIGPETQVLADLYCRVAYGQEQLAAHRRDHLRRLWQLLRATGSASA